MADRPVFLYAAVYDEIADAEADYEAVFDLHAAGAIGTFDSAVIRKEDDGKVRVTKTEKPTQHGAWTGAGVGALVGIIFPPAIIGTAIVGAGAGGLIGHLRGGVSRDDLKELGDALEEGNAAVYDNIADAEADYEAVFDLHALGAIGTFDSAVIRKEDDGKVRVTKTEKPTQHGAWTGAGVGALVGLIFPPAILGSAIVGAGAGALTGHLAKGISRGDLKELGEELEAGTAAVIVLGESKIEEQLAKALARAEKMIEKQVDADADELEREIDSAAKEGVS